ncbi:MAG TPA: TorF family putative porin [Steroidobacteraceae bacterium]|nr:TorF family putative porin [Steroidobacteraceae bacterium]
MTRNFGMLLLVYLGIGVAHSAVPEETGAREQGSLVVSGSLGATSDFVYRGLSLTRGKPAAQASIDLEFPHEFYTGGFIATADPNPGPSPNLEFDVWAGKYWRITDEMSVDLRLSQYTYPDDPRRVNYNRSEITATVGYRNQFFMAAIYSPNTRAVSAAPGYRDDGAWAFEISARHAFDERFAVAGGVGHYGLDGVYNQSFNYFNATLIADFKPFEFQLAWLGVDTDAAEIFPDDAVGNRVAFTALWRFSNAP